MTNIWTVAAAKARLSEVLRLASSEGPQWIGTRRQYVVVPAKDWEARNRDEGRGPLGNWLVQNLPRGEPEIELPGRADTRPIPFAEDDPA